MRPSIDEYLMGIARIVANRSTCTANHSTGAVATIDGRIIMTAYNGVPSGMRHCDDGGCVRLENGKHAFLLHAEENLIAQAAKYHVALNGATVYVTHFPCSHCTAIMTQAGIKAVIVGQYDDESTVEHDLVISVFHATKITCIPLSRASVWRAMEGKNEEDKS